MKIIIDAPGQTCNRLWSYIALVSEAISTGNKVTILRFDETISFFQNLIYSKYIKLPYYNKFLINIIGIRRYIYILNKILFNRYTIKLTFKYWNKKGVLVNGWDYRGENYDFEKNKKLLNEIFEPSNNIVREIDELFSEIRNTYDFIIGVHIRRGDYESWLNGKYYYQISEYFRYMKNFYNSLDDYKRICFFISSNENLDIGLFEGLHCFNNNNSSAILDLYGLSKCDRIMGPLSTYSRWASFYGEVPLCVLEKGEYNITDEDFSVVKSLYLRYDGKQFVNWTEIERINTLKTTLSQ